MTRSHRDILINLGRNQIFYGAQYYTLRASFAMKSGSNQQHHPMILSTHHRAHATNCAGISSLPTGVKSPEAASEAFG